jgi:hypothetical protein
VFLKHPDVVSVVNELGAHETVAETLTACQIDERRWASFAAALTNLEESEVIRAR